MTAVLFLEGRCLLKVEVGQCFQIVFGALLPFEQLGELFELLLLVLVVASPLQLRWLLLKGGAT